MIEIEGLLTESEYTSAGNKLIKKRNNK